jgi:hypothetical protein
VVQFGVREITIRCVRGLIDEGERGRRSSAVPCVVWRTWLAWGWLGDAGGEEERRRRAPAAEEEDDDLGVESARLGLQVQCREVEEDGAAPFLRSVRRCGVRVVASFNVSSCGHGGEAERQTERGGGIGGA